ncbi:LPS export ABC transporter periplasmic protein LptC [Geobacter sp. AOG1]|uniref:LPS export ABC transporter periplasmic protein LptC n=1 Tax=Geobacter sp. AOG1 TaxID=1566346 RepID=UPI001CC61D47|nr:LPS export ABC transporter periplasmic protein LptC [Geobacter sp. AOG1]GFE59377.1 LPS export ABC transporter periplasmic protein LptC [Geobacter sp. AOG1]
MNKIRLILAVIIVIAGGSLIATIVLKVSSDKRQPPVPPGLPRNVDVSLQKIHFTETRDGVKKWDLVADKAEYDKVHDKTHLTSVRMVVTGDRQTGDLTLTADRADYDNKSRDVKLAGRVEARSVSGMEFSSATAEYVAASGLLRTPDHVRYTDKKLTLEGVGMEMVTGTRNLKILRDVTTSIRSGAGK